MAKIILDHNVTNIDFATQPYNENFRKIEEELQGKILYRDNPSGEPNSMSSPLDMNGERIINLPDPVSDREPMTSRAITPYISQAAQSAEAAQTSADRAAQSVIEASQEVVKAAGYSGQAQGFRNTAGVYATQASNSADKAEKWSEAAPYIEVAPGEYSARHWASVAQDAVSGDAYLLKSANLGDISSPKVALVNLGVIPSISENPISTDDAADQSTVDAGIDDTKYVTAKTLKNAHGIGGATGGGQDAIFFLNEQHVTEDFTVEDGFNALSAGPITIDDGATVTIEDNASWTIVG